MTIPLALHIWYILLQLEYACMHPGHACSRTFAIHKANIQWSLTLDHLTSWTTKGSTPECYTVEPFLTDHPISHKILTPKGVSLW